MLSAVLTGVNGFAYFARLDPLVPSLVFLPDPGQSVTASVYSSEAAPTDQEK